jgi:hypothetical protein
MWRRLKSLAIGVLTCVLVGVAVTTTAPAALAAPPTPTADAPSQVSWAAGPADTAVGKGRAHFTYTLAPGGSITDAMAVVNRSDAPITLRVYASDAFTTSTGDIDLLPANKAPTDAGSWITTTASTITLSSQQSTIVQFTLKVPLTASPGDHSAGIVTSLVTGNSGAVTLDRRLGSRMYLRASGALAPAFKVSDVHASYDGTLNPTGSGATIVTYTVTNTGNVRLKAAQSIRVSGLFGLLSHTSTPADLPELLPGNSLTRTVTVPGVWPLAHLTAQVQLQPLASAGDPVVQVAPARNSDGLWALPWGQIVVLLLIAAAIATFVLLRRRRARVVQAAIDIAVASALQESGTSRTT